MNDAAEIIGPLSFTFPSYPRTSSPIPNPLHRSCSYSCEYSRHYLQITNRGSVVILAFYRSSSIFLRLSRLKCRGHPARSKYLRCFLHTHRFHSSSARDNALNENRFVRSLQSYRFLSPRLNPFVLLSKTIYWLCRNVSCKYFSNSLYYKRHKMRDISEIYLYFYVNFNLTC